MTVRSSEKSLLRILDANYNRAKEALRVCEDVARFYFSDARLTAHFKRLRHDLTRALIELKIPDRDMVAVRNSKEDVGRSSLIYDKKNPGWKDIFISNLKRGEEASRVLEEFSKMIDVRKTPIFQKIRFRLYELEKLGLQKF